MNNAHKLGKLRNRLNRCKKRLTDKMLTTEQRSMISSREAELKLELKVK
jgi:hypothetical protein